METLDYNPWYYYLNNKLVKQRKPCVTGNQIHIKKWMGCYNVHHVSVYGFTIEKNRNKVVLPWSEFECLKGESINRTSDIKRELKSLMIGNLITNFRIINLIGKINFQNN